MKKMKVIDALKLAALFVFAPAILFIFVIGILEEMMES